ARRAWSRPRSRPCPLGASANPRWPPRARAARPAAPPVTISTIAIIAKLYRETPRARSRGHAPQSHRTSPARTGSPQTFGDGRSATWTSQATAPLPGPDDAPAAVGILERQRPAVLAYTYVGARDPGSELLAKLVGHEFEVLGEPADVQRRVRTERLQHVDVGVPDLLDAEQRFGPVGDELTDHARLHGVHVADALTP